MLAFYLLLQKTGVLTIDDVISRSNMVNCFLTGLNEQVKYENLVTEPGTACNLYVHHVYILYSFNKDFQVKFLNQGCHVS